MEILSKILAGTNSRQHDRLRLDLSGLDSAGGDVLLLHSYVLLHRSESDDSANHLLSLSWQTASNLLPRL
jgi:hypothetical protein